MVTVCEQSVQDGLHSTRASQSYIQGLFRRQQPQKAAEPKEVVPTGTTSADSCCKSCTVAHVLERKYKHSDAVNITTAGCCCFQKLFLTFLHSIQII